MHFVAGIDFGRISPKSHTPQDVCLLPFSSGTSGLPKGVMLTHTNITANIEMFGVPLPHERLMLPTTNDYQEVLPCFLPFFHIYGFTILLMTQLSLGCKLVTLSRFEPNTFVNALAEHKATFLALVPPVLQFMTNDARCTDEHLRHLRCVVSGGAPLGAESVERFIGTKYIQL